MGQKYILEITKHNANGGHESSLFYMGYQGEGKTSFTYDECKAKQKSKKNIDRLCWYLQKIFRDKPNVYIKAKAIYSEQK